MAHSSLVRIGKAGLGNTGRYLLNVMLLLSLKSSAFRGCVTPKQISNLKQDIEGDANQLDGYDELPKDFQEKVVNALEQGHIDDEDWGWDVEMNRPGKNGYLTLESKRRLKAEAQVGPSILSHWLFFMSFSSNYLKALKDEAAGEGSAGPSKTDNKKRGHVKDDPDAEGAREGEPPTKKTKAKTKKEPIVKNEDADGGSENEGPTIKKTKARIKKEPIVKNEDADGGSENEGPTIKKTKARIKKEPKIKNENAEAKFENDSSANKKTQPAIKKGKKTHNAESEGDFEQDAQPVKKGRRQAKKTIDEEYSASHIKDESSDHDAPSPPAAKEGRAPRKAATAKRIKDQDTDSDSLDPASEPELPLDNVKLEHRSGFDAEASEGAPKFQKGRKKAPSKAVNGTAEETKKEVKSQVRMLVVPLVGEQTDDVGRQFRLPHEPMDG